MIAEIFIGLLVLFLVAVYEYRIYLVNKELCRVLKESVNLLMILNNVPNMSTDEIRMLITGYCYKIGNKDANSRGIKS